MKLSILICSLAARAGVLSRLTGVLKPQLGPDVEVLVNIDDGTKPIGRKRNELIARAKGEYVAFIDDDDLVSDDYVERIRAATQDSPDCVGIEGVITFNGTNPRRFIHSIQHTWRQEGGVYYRSPNHLNPIKRSLVVQCPFPEVNHGEDKAFSDVIRPLLKTEQYIDKTLYFYLYVRDVPVVVVKKKRPQIVTRPTKGLAG
jgi:glycosyltransferase involved in cell wall biosynthesis